MNCAEVASNRSTAALANGVSGMRTPASDPRRVIVAITELLIASLMPSLATDSHTLLFANTPAPGRPRDRLLGPVHFASYFNMSRPATAAMTVWRYESGAGNRGQPHNQRDTDRAVDSGHRSRSWEALFNHDLSGIIGVLVANWRC